MEARADDASISFAAPSNKGVTMGQAIDLPDPAQAPASAAATSADDLLSQLAGDEIDRLLAESDAEAAAQAETKAAETKAAEAQPTTPSAAEPTASAESTAASATSTEAPPPPSTEGLANELDSLLAQAVAKDEVPPAAEASPPTEPAASVDANIDATVDAKTLDASLAAQATTASPELQATVSEIETTLQERSGLTDSPTDEHAPEEIVDETPVPLYLKPLVWLNAPLLLLPEPLRDAIGKIAILTLFNSLAVLTYVMMFRRHHH
jgi:hypothetical protein